MVQFYNSLCLFLPAVDFFVFIPYIVMKTVIISLGGVLHFYRKYQEIQQLITAVILTCCLMKVMKCESH